MITRLQVSGFKNLNHCDVRFGPITCIAGLNGVGKSNIFDAILFLSYLADMPLMEACKRVRGGGDIVGLFNQVLPKVMKFDVEILIPSEGEDYFGQKATASSTFLKYSLELKLRKSVENAYSIEIESEELTYIPKSRAKSHLLFPFSEKWLSSVIPPATRTTSFIKTEPSGKFGKSVSLQSDRTKIEGGSKRGGGKPFKYIAEKLPRTVLSSAQNAEENRTAVLLRNEMRQWRQLQLEPSSLRKADEFDSENHIDASGSHIPSTLYRVARTLYPQQPERIYTDVANELSQLVDGVHSVWVDRDESRRVQKFLMRDIGDVALPAESLSDGTMRFVALTVLAMDPDEIGVICLEEPENGIHPQKIEAMVRLLYKLSVNTNEAISDDNPLRQILISTHSPVVVKALKTSDVLFAVRAVSRINGATVSSLKLMSLRSQWRARKNPGESVPVGSVIGYLNGTATDQDFENLSGEITVQSWIKEQLDLFDSSPVD